MPSVSEPSLKAAAFQLPQGLCHHTSQPQQAMLARQAEDIRRGHARWRAARTVPTVLVLPCPLAVVQTTAQQPQLPGGQAPPTSVAAMLPRQARARCSQAAARTVLMTRSRNGRYSSICLSVSHTTFLYVACPDWSTLSSKQTVM